MNDYDIQEAAHKNVLLYKLLKHFDFYCAKVTPLAPSCWGISLAKESYAKTGWARIMKIGVEGKSHKLISYDKNIGALYARSSAFPNAKSALGLVSLLPCIDNKEQLLGKAAIFDTITKLPYGFSWKKSRYGTIEGEIEELLATFDIQYTSSDATLEDGMVELVHLHDIIHRSDDLLAGMPT